MGSEHRTCNGHLSRPDTRPASCSNPQSAGHQSYEKSLSFQRVLDTKQVDRRRRHIFEEGRAPSEETSDARNEGKAH